MWTPLRTSQNIWDVTITSLMMAKERIGPPNVAMVNRVVAEIISLEKDAELKAQMESIAKEAGWRDIQEHFPVVKVMNTHNSEKKRIQLCCPTRHHLLDPASPHQKTFAFFFPHIQKMIEGTKGVRQLPASAPPGQMEKELSTWLESLEEK